MGIFSKANLIGDVIGILLVVIVWFFSGFYKKKVIGKWLIRFFAFLTLSAGFMTIGIIFFLVKTTIYFWYGLMTSIGSLLFAAFVFSIYFLITRGIVFPKKKKRDREYLKKQGLEEWKIKIYLEKYDE